MDTYIKAKDVIGKRSVMNVMVIVRIEIIMITVIQTITIFNIGWYKVFIRRMIRIFESDFDFEDVDEEIKNVMQ